MFGPGIPELFIIGFLAISMLQAVEKYSLAYYHRVPSKFDASLNDNIVKDLHWPPLLYSLIGFWMFSNKQLFDNNIVFRDNLSSTARYDHTVAGSLDLKEFNPGQPLLILALIQIVVLVRKIINP